LAEARRVLRPMGSSLSSTAISQLSPSRCSRAIRCRRPQGRCCVKSVEPHGYVQATSPAYLLTLLSRGTRAAAQAGEIGQELVDSFDREARRRVANGSFYGAMLFLSLTARKDAE
jgi:hypothetical protein